MSREEDKELLSNLIFANRKFAENLEELKKLDGLAARAAALNEVDTQKILESLDKVGFTQISRKIVDTIREQLEASRAEIVASSQKAEAAAKDLSQKTELLKESSDSLLQIDNMASDLDDLVKSVKNWKMKNIYAAIGLSLFFGIASGSIASYFILNLSNSNEAQTIQNAELLKERFGKIAVLPHDTNPNVFYFAFGAKELKKEVQTLEKDGVRYIMFQSQNRSKN